MPQYAPHRTQYSPIAPIQILEQLVEQNLLHNYLLLLAHDVLASPDRYMDLIENWRAKHGNSTIIMDNGVIERGAPVKVQELLEASGMVEADVVVGPDVLGDYAGTKKLMMDQADIIRRYYPLMFIPQGETFAEILNCIDWYADRFPEVTLHDIDHPWWGVPRWIANKQGSRMATIDNIIARNRNAKIHLLGMSHFWDDDLECCKHPNVVGIDSANPLVLGMNHKAIQEHEHMDRGEYWDTDVLTPLMAYNVEWVHSVLSL